MRAIGRKVEIDVRDTERQEFVHVVRSAVEATDGAIVDRAGGWWTHSSGAIPESSRRNIVRSSVGEDSGFTNQGCQPTMTGMSSSASTVSRIVSDPRPTET